MYDLEKVLPALMSFGALLWAVYSFFRQRKDRKHEMMNQAETDLERAHLTEASELRRELRQEIRELKVEHEETLKIFDDVSRERLALRSEVSRLKIENETLRDALKRSEANIRNRDDIIEGLEKTIRKRDEALAVFTSRLNEAGDA